MNGIFGVIEREREREREVGVISTPQVVNGAEITICGVEIKVNQICSAYVSIFFFLMKAYVSCVVSYNLWFFNMYHIKINFRRHNQL